MDVLRLLAEGMRRRGSAANPCHYTTVSGPAPSGPQEPGYLWAYGGLQCRYRLDASMPPRCPAQAEIYAIS
jgi:hypothetical protein